jgi:hypothetical protein
MISPQIHWFNMQGYKKLYLAYEPLFHKSNGRSHLILSGDINLIAKGIYNTARATHPDRVYQCRTVDKMTLDDIINKKEFKAIIEGE